MYWCCIQNKLYVPLYKKYKVPLNNACTIKLNLQIIILHVFIYCMSLQLIISSYLLKHQGLPSSSQPA